VSWEKKLPNKAKSKKKSEAFMIRPPKQVCEWLAKKSAEHQVSANKIICAILEAAMDECRAQGKEG
jgi:predicted HicB family RNase H-like nuclease